MALGSPITSAFPIGTAELRVGPMASASKLTQAQSVGLIDDASVTVSQETKELEGMFPQQLIASAVIKQLATAKATMREYSRRNLNVLLGNGIPAAVTNVATTIAADLALSASGAALGLGTGFTVGDICVIYQAGYPETVSIVKLLTVAGANVTWAANSLSTALVAAAGVIHFYKANEIALGNVTQVNYFAATLIQQGTTGKPQVFHFWKASVAGNMEYATSATDFASTSLEMKVLIPSAADVAGALSPVASIIATNPLGLFIVDG